MSAVTPCKDSTPPPEFDDVPANLIKEIKGVLATECMNMISENTMNVSHQRAAIFDRYHGNADNMVGQIQKFLGGQGTYDNIWETIDMPDHGPQRVIISTLHCQDRKYFVAGGNITRFILERARTTNSALIAGWTLRERESTRMYL